MTVPQILQPGIISVVQTPFLPDGAIDFASLQRLIEDAIGAGVDGFLAPAVASEIAFLSERERMEIVCAIQGFTGGRVPLVVGASAEDPQQAMRFAKLAEEVGAAAYLVAVPAELYARQSEIVPFFCAVAQSCDLPLLIQDLQWNGPGLELETIEQLREALPTLLGLKIETVPAGPKYTAVRKACGAEFFIAGGWAVPQWIEALDRGIDALMPESSMINLYSRILALYRAGRRQEALGWFWRLLPVLAFTNQEINTSIAFFKRLLVRRGIIRCERTRQTSFVWEPENERIANELIGLYFKLEGELALAPAAAYRHSADRPGEGQALPSEFCT